MRQYDASSGGIGDIVGGDDPSVVVRQLRERLEETMTSDTSAKAALTKSDAVILDLRSNQRHLKRQLDLLHEERAEINKELQIAKADVANARTNTNGSDDTKRIESLQAHIRDITQRLEDSQKKQREQQTKIQNINNNSSSLHSRDDNKNAKVGELQVQLDRAHAQILTADMVRKELEDTLEAEQYTWELRVQDQERQIAKLQHEYNTLILDLDQCRIQWKDAEVGWNEELNELRGDLVSAQRQLKQQREKNSAAENSGNSNINDSSAQRELLQKIHQLESEISKQWP